MTGKGSMSLAEATPRSGRRALLAEDDAALRQLLALTLRRSGFAVTEAASGDEALDRIGDQLLQEGAFDLVVADIHMPGCTGLDLLACLRHFDRRTPVILITAFGNRETHERARRLGAIAVFDKPFDLGNLRSVLSSATRTER